jgi:hypothetical protein
MSCLDRTWFYCRLELRSAWFLIRFRLQPGLDQVHVLPGQDVVLLQARATLGLVFNQVQATAWPGPGPCPLGQDLVLMQVRATLGLVIDQVQATAWPGPGPCPAWTRHGFNAGSSYARPGF